jgi:hypothetical protein
MRVVSFVVTALSEQSLCLPAANALKELCDANRVALAPHINAFGTLHAGLASIPVSVSVRQWSRVSVGLSRLVVQLGDREEQGPAIHSKRDPSYSPTGGYYASGGTPFVWYWFKLIQRWYLGDCQPRSG